MNELKLAKQTLPQPYAADIVKDAYTYHNLVTDTQLNASPDTIPRALARPLLLEARPTPLQCDTRNFLKGLAKKGALCLMGAALVTGHISTSAPANESPSKSAQATRFEEAPQNGVYPRPTEGLDRTRWGYTPRGCVWFVGWRLWLEGTDKRRFSGLGEAKDWERNAKKRFEKIDSTPAVGAAVIIDNGNPTGHAGFVEAIDELGRVTYSEYNGSRPLDYALHTIDADTAKKLRYVHFYLPPVANGDFVGLTDRSHVSQGAININRGLTKGEFIISRNGDYKLAIDKSNRLVLYDQLFRRKTLGKNVLSVQLEKDKKTNKLIYIGKRNRRIKTIPIGNATKVVLQNNGNLAAVRGNATRVIASAKRKTKSTKTSVGLGALTERPQTTEQQVIAQHAGVLMLLASRQPTTS